MDRRSEVLKYFDEYKEETSDRVRHGIEQNRKGYGTITIKDKDGNYIVGADVKITQKKHEFLHGANIFMLDEFEKEEKNAIYRESFKKILNFATLPFYWSDLEPCEGKPRFSKNSPKIYRRPAPDLCLEYLEENDIKAKAHCLTYFPFTPSWVDVTDINKTKQCLEKRFKELSDRYAQRISDWEVINEVLVYNMLADNSKDRDREVFFHDPMLVEWNFKTAEKYFPYNKLIINEASPVWGRWMHFNYNRSPYYMIIERALKNNSRIDAVGLQYHVFADKETEMRDTPKIKYNPRNLFAVLDCYSDFGKPIQITEVTIPAQSDSAEDEQIQADLVENIYSLWFSHRSVENITYWNLVDGYAAFGEIGDMTAGENMYRGGLMRFDMSKKPAFDVIEDMFTRRWITNTKVTTDKNGNAKFKGFYGEYEIECNGKKQLINLSSKKTNDFEMVIIE